MDLRKAGIPAKAGPEWHPRWRDVESALRATKRLVALAERHRKRVHVLHVSTAEEMDFLAAHRDQATVEVLVGRLRRKLGVDLIETRRGFGYLVAQPNPA